MGHGRLIQQKESTRLKRCWMDYLLYQDRLETGVYLLGEVNGGKLISCMLDLCTLHLLAQAVAEFYKVDKWAAILCCDNKRALELYSHHRCRIRPSAKCTDIRQNLRAIKQSFTGNFKYIHVYGHMD